MAFSLSTSPLPRIPVPTVSIEEPLEIFKTSVQHQLFEEASPLAHLDFRVPLVTALFTLL
jgi:hypothetical protein